MININNNSYYKGEYIVSYDKNKTWIETQDNILVFCKKTNYEEVKNYHFIKDIMKDQTINISGKEYILEIPKVLKWSEKDNILYLEYCQGDNLEFYLRSKVKHVKGKLILNSLLDFFIDNKIFWLDFAPRNIIIKENVIILVDFEKGFLKESAPLVEYFRNHVYEEYGLFLLKDERKDYFKDVFYVDECENTVLEIDKIESIRFRELAKLLGYNKTITMKEYLQILKIVIEVEEPFIQDGEFVFPGVILDKYIIQSTSSKPIEDYAKEVIKLYKKRS